MTIPDLSPHYFIILHREDLDKFTYCGTYQFFCYYVMLQLYFLTQSDILLQIYLLSGRASLIKQQLLTMIYVPLQHLHNAQQNSLILGYRSCSSSVLFLYINNKYITSSIISKHFFVLDLVIFMLNIPDEMQFLKTTFADVFFTRSSIFVVP